MKKYSNHEVDAAGWVDDLNCKLDYDSTVIILTCVFLFQSDTIVKELCNIFSLERLL